MILEIGLMVTDPTFTHVLYCNHFLVKFDTPEAVETRRSICSAYVREMHDKNGLWEDLKKASQGYVIQRPGAPDECSLPIEQLDVHIGQILDQYAPAIPNEKAPDRPTRSVGFGNNFEGFDLKFLKVDMPETFKRLHYRTINASSLREDIEGSYGVKLDESDNTQHRVLADLAYSLKARRWALDVLRGKYDQEIAALHASR
jgi:oligoribonuclease (3'-5' exoribonuclease)